jgi:hypothetical protein
MISDSVSLIQAIVKDQLFAFKTAEIGIVTKTYSHEAAADQNNYECDVQLRDQNIELQRVPVCTSRIGSVAIPNPDDLVLVQFLHGDIQSPVIVGRLYNDKDRPPEAKSCEFVYISQDQPQSGTRRIYLEFPNSNKLLLDDDKMVMEMGKTTLTVNRDGDVVLSSNAKVSLQSKGDTSIQVHGNLELNAKGNVKLNGANIDIKATGNATLEGSSAATVKGMTVKIAGKTDFSLA